MSEFLNAANCFSFHVWSYNITLLSDLVGFFFFFIIYFILFPCKNRGELGIKRAAGDIFCPCLTCINPDLLWKKAMAASAQEILQYTINSLPAQIFDVSLPYVNDQLKCMFFKSKQESTIWSAACAELGRIRISKPFTRNDYCRERIRSRSRAAALAGWCLNFCSEILCRQTSPF